MKLDLRFMRRALALAKKGEKRVHPNPLVGCVIVRDGKVVGEGFHGFFGGPHAEVNALSRAGTAARGATLYVTLEPCDHWGKTPPCTGAIIRSGIRRVVAAIADPNPRTSGHGFRRLRSRGIEVRCGVLAAEAKRLNSRYLRSFAAPETNVTVKAAVSLDGKIAAKTGDSRWITGPAARQFVHRLRSRFDAILVGVKTVICDDPALTSHGAGPDPVRVVIDPALKIPLKSRVLDGSVPTVIIHAGPVPAAKRTFLNERSILVRIPRKTGSIDFKHIFKHLRYMSIYKVLIEGGGETIARAFKAGVVDDVVFFIAPKLVGGRDAKTAFEGGGITRMADALPLNRVRWRKIGDDMMVTGSVNN